MWGLVEQFPFYLTPDTLNPVRTTTIMITIVFAVMVTIMIPTIIITIIIIIIIIPVVVLLLSFCFRKEEYVGRAGVSVAAQLVLGITFPDKAGREKEPQDFVSEFHRYW